MAVLQVEKLPAELQMEETRVQIASMIKEVRTMADGMKLQDAQDKLVNPQNMLEEVAEQFNPMVGMLRTELLELLKVLKTPETYQWYGRPSALSSETSHDRQQHHFASRGSGDIETVSQMFATDGHVSGAGQDFP
ncbi:hypothetical protein BRADI_4g12695v3 [Brachypodium distachyon]|uniref:DOG1 domain-containing protein n=2 Tax=Brachypodium distachyon TaxID=15368 RepID=I1IK36_BRADI|nr:hypothetical protein BRADI_4g12695v3 [Brachypodium distachyon]